MKPKLNEIFCYVIIYIILHHTQFNKKLAKFMNLFLCSYIFYHEQAITYIFKNPPITPVTENKQLQNEEKQIFVAYQPDFIILKFLLNYLF